MDFLVVLEVVGGAVNDGGELGVGRDAARAGE
jgi:hypothetical protein